MDARTIISKVRAGDETSVDEMRWFAAGLATGGVSDAQAGAFAMAACLNGLGDAGRVALTTAMRDSGDVMAWDLNGPVLDKHSTGGIGDCVSLVLAPVLAACGAYVPMISGRGLGHTGGTLDKLEAIPGLSTEVNETTLRDIVGNVGCAIVSASGNIAPADKRLYAVRDVTSTVDNIDLITASILSKKLAAGLDGLVLDVKVGTGAFMTEMSEATTLAEALVTTASQAGCPTSALITNMDQPVITSMGNALEVMEVLEVLTTGRQGRLFDLVVELGTDLLVQGGLYDTVDHAKSMIKQSISGGDAAEVFAKMVFALGGPPDFVEQYGDRLPAAPVVMDIMPNIAGRVVGMDGTALGMTVVHLGGGRLRDGDAIDPSVGLTHVANIGEVVDEYTPLARVHAQSPSEASRAADQVRAAFDIGETAFHTPPLIHKRITS